MSSRLSRKLRDRSCRPGLFVGVYAMKDRQIQIIELRESILADNDADADLLRRELKARKTYYLNLMSSPGSGKTSMLLASLPALASRLKVGVIEADIDSDVDARTIAKTGTPAVQVHTGGMCHLDAEMSRQGLRAIGSDALDLVILENVGNLVCPAEFDTGAVKNAVILSIPEGDDKPLKYPLMFEKADVVLVNKIDALPVFDFDFDAFTRGIRLRNADCPIFPVSAATGEGIDAWTGWLLADVQAWLKED